MIELLDCHSNTNLISFVPLLALFLSIIVYFSSVYFSRKNILLSIQQMLFKTVSEKAKDCNALWESEPANELKNPNSPHFKVMSELVITKEIIEKSMDLFGKNSSKIKYFKDDYYYYLFWKQLDTDLRGWFRRTPQIAQNLNNEIYAKQMADVHAVVQKHFE